MCCTTEEKRIEEKRVEEKNGEFLCPLSRSMQYNFALDDYIESTCCCVHARFIGMETKIILFPLLWYIQAHFFYNVFEALN